MALGIDSLASFLRIEIISSRTLNTNRILEFSTIKITNLLHIFNATAIVCFISWIACQTSTKSRVKSRAKRINLSTYAIKSKIESSWTLSTLLFLIKFRTVFICVRFLCAQYTFSKWQIKRWVATFALTIWLAPCQAKGINIFTKSVLGKICSKSTFSTLIISPLCTVWTSSCCILLTFSWIVGINHVAFVATSALAWVRAEQSTKRIDCLTFPS